MEEVATDIKEEGEDAWPRTFTSHGDPATDAVYAKISASKAHNIPEPSHKSFVVETEVSGGELRVVMKSRANWAYKIRSRQVGETRSQRESRFRWEKGQTEDEYRSQTQLGRKRHAWSTIMIRPFKKVQRQLGAVILDIIEKGM